MKYIQVSEEMYADPRVQSSSDGKHWEPARPELLHPSLFESIKHALGKHWTYGQPYCVVCGKKAL